MKNLKQLKIRTIDSHTVLLGINDHWFRLNLPWISRDIGMLIGQLEQSGQEHDDPLERLPVLKILLTQLSLTSEEKSTPQKQTSTEDAKLFYSEAMIIPLKALEKHRDEPKLIVTTTISELLLYEKDISKHKGLISLLVYSDQAMVLGTILKGIDYCPFCYRHLLATPFGLSTPNREKEEKQFLKLGFQLGKIVERKEEEMLFFDGKSIKVEPFRPFIGCPSCFSNESS